MCDIVEYSPSGHMFSPCLNKMEVDSVKGQGHCLQVHQHTHNNVYSVHFVSTRLQDERPETGAQEEY